MSLSESHLLHLAVRVNDVLGVNQLALKVDGRFPDAGRLDKLGRKRCQAGYFHLVLGIEEVATSAK